MRVAALALVLLVSFLFFEYAKADKKHRRNDYGESEDNGVRQNKRDHEYKKYRKGYSNGYESRGGKGGKTDDDDEDESSEEEIISYRRKKDAPQKKKTLGMIFEEKKQKKEEKKKKFKKNVLRHFANDDSDDVESSEEVIAPLRKVNLIVECDSDEDDCD